VGEVVTFTGITKLDLPPDRILEAAVGTLEGVIIIGYTKEGAEYFSSSYADNGRNLWLAERFVRQLLETE
jgi:hypothetical protein